MFVAGTGPSPGSKSAVARRLGVAKRVYMCVPVHRSQGLRAYLGAPGPRVANALQARQLSRPISASQVQQLAQQRRGREDDGPYHMACLTVVLQLYG